jgi:hypothetical protein
VSVFSGGGESSKDVNGEVPEKKRFPESEGIEFIEFGETIKNIPLQLLTTYPQGAGFPFFTWAQQFFTNADQVSPRQLPYSIRYHSRR